MDEQQTPIPTAGSPIYQESQGKNAKWLWLLIIFIIIAALVFAFLRGIGPFSKISPLANKEEVSPTPVSFFSPSPSEASPAASNLNKAEPKIRVLNGSGTHGMASSFKDFLEKLGYKVASIGNADNYDYANTQLRFKEDFKKFKDILVSDLSNKYSVKVGSSDLSSTDSADIEIIVGSK